MYEKREEKLKPPSKVLTLMIGFKTRLEALKVMCVLSQ